MISPLPLDDFATIASVRDTEACTCSVKEYRLVEARFACHRQIAA